MAVLQAKQRELLGVLWFETVLTLATVGLRWYTRQFIRGHIGWDDRFLAISWVSIYHDPMISSFVKLTVYALRGLLANNSC